MAERFGIDSNGGVDLGRAVAAGVTFACRYCSDDDYAPQRNLTRAEADSWRAAGVDLVSVWERSAEDGGKGTRSLDGWHAGRHDAIVANRQQAEQGGSGQPIYFTVDFPVRRHHVKRIVPYFDGINAVLPLRRIGVYGSRRVVGGLLDRKLARFGWQTIAFDGPGNLDPRLHLWQYAIEVADSFGSPQLDYDAALRAGFGQWA